MSEEITITLDQFCSLFAHAKDTAKRLIEYQTDTIQESLGLISQTNQKRQDHDEFADEYDSLYWGLLDSLKGSASTGRRIVNMTLYLDDFGVDDKEVKSLRGRLHSLIEYAEALTDASEAKANEGGE